MRRVLLILFALAACQLPRPADVPDVDAMPPTFAIGGRVSSMWPNVSVKLLLSSGSTTEELVVDHNGDFAFQTHLDNDALYDVEVVTPPPLHDCTIDAAQGRVLGADVSLEVDCRAVHDVELSAGSPWTFDPSNFNPVIPVSLLASRTTITVDAPNASSIMVNGTHVESGVPSDAVALAPGTTTVAIMLTIGGETKTYSLGFSQGAIPIAQYGYVKAPNTDAGDEFGTSIAMFENWLAVGAPGEASASTGIGGNSSDNSAPGTGAVYIYRRRGVTWTFVSYLKPPLTGQHAFGRALAMSSGHLVVGSDARVFVYSFDPGSGQIVAEGSLVGSGSEATDGFGSSVSIDGAAIAVGAPFEDSAATTVDGDSTDNSSTDSGAAYVFRESVPGTWSQDAYLKANDNQKMSHFGTSVVIAPVGTLQSVLVSAPGEDNLGAGRGEVYDFDYSAPKWVFYQGSAAVTCCVSAGQGLGASLAVDGSHGLLAAGTTPSIAPSGVAALGTPFVPNFTSTATPTNPIGPEYGRSVSVASSRLVVGDPSDAGDGLGVDPAGDQTRTESGAAYVFDVDNNQHATLRSYIKASNSRRGMQFGDEVLVSENTLVVGAPHEQSSSTGINNNQLDASYYDAGAVYIFQ